MARQHFRHHKKLFLLFGLPLVTLLFAGGVYAAINLNAPSSPNHTKTNSAINIDSAEAGLVGYWQLNGNAKDSTPYSNNGTLVNAPTPTAGPQGQTNGALNFNGTSQYVNVPNNPILDAGTGSMSWSEWFKTTQAGGFLYRKSASCNVNGEITQMTGSGALYSYIVVGGNCTADTTVSLTSPRTYDDGNWHLATTVLNRTADTLSLYVDGMQVATTSAAALSAVSLTNSSPAVIGSSYSAGYFSGSLADVRIYNQALTASQITNLYQAGSSQIEIGGSGLAGSISLGKGLVGYWPFTGNPKDATPYAHNGVIEGSVSLTTDRFGRANSAYYFNSSGTTTSYIDTGYNFPLQNFSVALWVDPNGGLESGSTFATIISNSRNCCSVNNGFQIDYSTYLGARLWAGGSSPASSLTYSTLPVNTWSFIVISYDSSTFELYYNGLLVASQNVSGMVGSSADHVYIGRMGSSGSGWGFNGSLDDVRIYNRALSAAEVSALYSEN